MTMKTTILSTAAFVAWAAAASAGTVFNGGDLVIGDIGIGNGFTEPTETLEFTYTATEAMRVLNFVSISSVGFSGGADLALVTYGIDSPNVYTSFSQNGATTEANSTLPGFTLAAGESFTLTFAYGDGAQTTSHQYSFATAAVPLPAGVLLLGTALGGLGLARRKKKAA